MRYRKEVDGLRALAVIPVILFHAGVSNVNGGFVGVDVFFVISGFLITTSLIGDESFHPLERIARFYDRRIRRIIPSLTIIVIAALTFSVKILLPSEFISLSKSAVATELFISNFWFWTQSGYFGGPAQSMPLLHTWSLAVEEQFYILFPFFIIVVGNQSRKHIFLYISFLATLIFVISLYLSEHKPGVAFYWPTRAWELLIGAALAFRDDEPRPMREAIASIGFASIIASIFGFDDMTPFPGYAALAPVLGTAAVIYGGGETVVGRILSLRPFVSVGLISYSLYLWHWPVLVFARQAFTSSQLTPAQTTGCILATFIMAYISWRFVEIPFRKRPLPRSRLFVRTGALIGGIVSVSVAIVALGGFPNRFSKEALALSRAKTAERPNNCVQVDRFSCRVGVTKPKYVLWGDSHAGALSSAISNISSEAGLYAIFNACPPLPSFAPDGLRGDDLPNCIVRNKLILDKITSDDNLDTVILSAFWSSYKLNEADVRYILNALKGKNVIIVGDNPIPGFNVPRTLAIGGIHKKLSPSVWPKVFYILPEYNNVTIVNLSDVLCDESECALRDGWNSLYADGNHISEYAANNIITPFLQEKISRFMRVSAKQESR